LFRLVTRSFLNLNLSSFRIFVQFFVATPRLPERVFATMAQKWMDFKMAAAAKAQKLNEYSKRTQVQIQKGTGDKPKQSRFDITT
jgi:hypothetical protein